MAGNSMLIHKFDVSNFACVAFPRNRVLQSIIETFAQTGIEALMNCTLDDLASCAAPQHTETKTMINFNYQQSRYEVTLIETRFSTA
jgi:hypothetical protein